MCKINFSEEQEKIFNFAEKGLQNMIVQAVAGAGKTTTLVECAKRISDGKTVMMLAHNRSTRDTLVERVGINPNVKIYTIHGLGYRLFVEHFCRVPNINDEKYKNYLFDNIENIAYDSYFSLSKRNRGAYLLNVLELINKGRLNLKQSEKELTKLAKKKYHIPIMSDECLIAEKILKWGAQTTEEVDFIDLLWLPQESGYFTKKYLSDIIMLDEAQDASIAQQDIISRCFKRNTRLFSFGDSDQMINAWCGSDIDSFESLKDSTKFRRDSVEFSLSTNYRCAKSIIEYAKQYTEKEIKPRDNANDGEIIYDTSLQYAKDGDMVLCRNCSPLMLAYREGLTLGKKMYFKDEEMANGLQMALKLSDGDSIKDIINGVKNVLISRWNTLEKNNDVSSTTLQQHIIPLYNIYKTLESLPSTVTDRNMLEKFIKTVFFDKPSEGIMLSTIHKAKGLEANNVFVICPSLMPSSLAEEDWEKIEENNLFYVMTTRAKNTLNFVSEYEIRPYDELKERNKFIHMLKKLEEN